MPGLKRLLPRFSLRTLAIFLLLVTSGMALWAHWEAWYVEHVLRGHKGAVLSVAFSRAAVRIASAGEDDTVHMWNALSGKHLGLRSMETQQATIGMMPPRRVVMAAGWSIDRREEGAGEQVRFLKLTDCWRSGGARKMPDGSWASTERRCSYDALIWSGEDRRFRRVGLRGHKDTVVTAAFSPGGSKVVTASADGSARVYYATDGHHLLTLYGSSEDLVCAGFSATGMRIVTAAEYGTVKIWSAHGGGELADLPSRGKLTAAALSPDGATVAIGTPGGRAGIRDAATGTVLAEWAAHEGAVRSLAFSRDGLMLASASDDGTVRIYRSRRPEWWWGVFWLWEFWLTATFAAIFVWSVIRDCRRFARTG